MTIAITAATGQLGHLVLKSLAELAPAEVSKFVALARSPEKLTDFAGEARAFDYNNPDPAALTGVSRLLLISGTDFGQRTQQHSNVINAAKAAGVGHILYTSLLRADVSGLSVAPEHKATEEVIKASGLAYTFLRNGWYAENHTTAASFAAANGTLFGAAGNAKFSSASRADYAAAAATALLDGVTDNRIFELAGDNAFTLSDLAAEIGKQLGKPVAYQNLPVAEYAKALANMGLPAFIAEAIAQWDDQAQQGYLFDESQQLSKLIGRPTTSLAAAVTAALGA